MNIIKKAPLMAFVLGLGLLVGLNSFKSDSKFDTVTYYHVGNSYVQTQPPNRSCKPDDFYCTVTITSDTPPVSFAEGAIPAGATLGAADASWLP